MAQMGILARKHLRWLTAFAASACLCATSGIARADDVGAHREMQVLYSKGQFDTLISHGNAFEQNHPESPLDGQVRNLMGLSFLATKRPLQATIQFRKALELSDNSVFSQFVSFNLAAALYESGEVAASESVLSDMRSQMLDRDTRIKFHTLRARVLQKLEQPAGAARELYLLTAQADDPSTRRTVSAQLQSVLQSIRDVSALESLYSDFESSPIADLVLFRLAIAATSAGKTGLAESSLKTLVQKFPQSRHARTTAELLKSIENESLVDPQAVGVLLPLSGKFAKFGNKSLQAIQLALRIFNLGEPESRLSLVIEDSGEDPQQAIRALDRLFFRHRVIAVIGPMTSKGIDLVAARAQELGLPMLSLAQQAPEVGGGAGEFVFNSGLTPKLQAEEIARHAIQRLKITRFAIVHPRDRFGEEYSQSFWNAVEKLGGQVVGIESYLPGETDFRQVVDRLSGLHYTDARKRELDELAKQREELKITRRTRKTEQYYALKPIVNYQAVFIPDEPKVVSQILPTFAYRDVDQVKFLGTATWHSPLLPERAQAYAEGALFTDAFFADSARPQVKKFVTRYRSTFEQEPGVIEALAYDAASVLEKVLTGVGGSNATNRVEVRERLAALEGFQGVTGAITTQEGHMTRSMMILTVNGGKIIEVK